MNPTHTFNRDRHSNSTVINMQLSESYPLYLVIAYWPWQDISMAIQVWLKLQESTRTYPSEGNARQFSNKIGHFTLRGSRTYLHRRHRTPLSQQWSPSQKQKLGSYLMQHFRHDDLRVVIMFNELCIKMNKLLTCPSCHWNSTTTKYLYHIPKKNILSISEDHSPIHWVFFSICISWIWNRKLFLLECCFLHHIRSVNSRV